MIRPATDADWPAIWPTYRAIVLARETYAHDPDATSDEGRAMWLSGPAFVAVDGEEVLGSSKVGANRDGPGAHVATASFMVAPEHAGRGVGRALGEHAMAWAREQGFEAMQFNAVVETNTAAVHLWRSLGMRIIGTVPGAFRHPVHGDVGLHVMHRFL